MGDAGEGLIDAEARIQERMEEMARERAERRRAEEGASAEPPRVLESLRLARIDLDRQLNAATNPRHRAQLEQAVAEIDRRMTEAGGTAR